MDTNLVETIEDDNSSQSSGTEVTEIVDCVDSTVEEEISRISLDTKRGTVTLSEDEEETGDNEVQVPTRTNVSRKRTGGPQNMGRESRPALNKKDKNVLLDGLKFMGEFNPQNSSRNQQKMKKRYHPVDGRLIQYSDDFEECDCLRPGCPGCHFPCRTCNDPRCGTECRVNRRWIYESVELEGRSIEFKNPNSNSFV